LYGYDILIEENLKPWLIEVNASPSLSTTTEADRKMKMNIMESTFRIVIPPEWFEENSKHGTNLCKENQVDSFSLIINENS
jgi:tubulin polyglutamylase TTLL1